MNIEKPNLKFSKPLTPITAKIKKIVCHHPAHPSWTIQDIHNYHRNGNKWIGIGYNYFVTFDGRIQQGRGRNIGAHVAGHNSNTLGVCFQGDFSKQQMTDAQVKAGAQLIAHLLKSEGLQIADVIGHKDLAATSCPGKNFRMSDLKDEIKKVVSGVSKNPSNWAKSSWDKAVKQGVVDGTDPLGPLTREQFVVILDRLGLVN